MSNTSYSRRVAVKSTVFGLLTIAIPNLVFGKKIYSCEALPTPIFNRYPCIDDEVVAEVVSVSHFDLNRLKEMVNHRTELARATWDWGFGDWETAIGAASHVGRKDIADFLMSKGARPDIFTYAMLGGYDAVKAMIETTPGIQSTWGPHGITLLQHAKNGFRAEGPTEVQKSGSAKLIAYLEGLGNADLSGNYSTLRPEEKEKFLGDYKYADGPDDGFSIRLNLKKALSLGKIGKFGGALYKKSDDTFMYNGISSVEISFTIEKDKVTALMIKEPDVTVVARKV